MRDLSVDCDVGSLKGDLLTTIEHFERRHVDGVAHLLREVFPRDTDKIRERLKATLKEPKGTPLRDRNPVFVAVNGSDVVGYAAARPFVAWFSGYEIARSRSDTAELIQVAVSPTARGHGLGTELFEATVERCFEAGYRQVLSHIKTSDAQFYREAGWTVPAERDGWVWVENRSIDDRQIAVIHNVKDPKDPNWVPLMMQSPSTPGFPLLARKATADFELATTYTPRGSAVHDAKQAQIALAKAASRLDMWNQIPSVTRGLFDDAAIEFGEGPPTT